MKPLKYKADTVEAFGMLSRHLLSSKRTGSIAYRHYDHFWSRWQTDYHVYADGKVLGMATSYESVREMLALPTWRSWLLWRLVAVLALLECTVHAVYAALSNLAMSIDKHSI